MNTFTTLSSRLVVGTLLVGLGMTSPAVAATPASPTYKLFVGLDVEVPHQEGFQPMRRLTNRNRDVEIAVDGLLHQVNINRSESLRLRRQLKVSRSTAAVTGLKSVRTYSVLSDPYRRWVRAHLAVEAQSQERSDISQYKYSDNILNHTALETSYIGPDIAASRARALAQLDRNVNASPIYDFSQISARIAGSHDEDTLDAFEASFELASPEPIADVDLVLVADYRAPGRPDEPRRVIFTRALGAIGPQPRQETVFVQHLPPGFELKQTSIFLYSFGEEIATNLSEKPVDLTAEQAYSMLTAQHLSAHRQRSVPAQPLWVTAPRNFRALLDQVPLPAVAVLHIGPDGQVQALQDDQGQPLRATGVLRRVLTETRFLPALENGQPVASTLRIDVPVFLQ